MCTKRTAAQCDECELDEAMVKRFKVSSGWIDRCHGDGGSLRHVSGNKSETAQFLDEVCRSGPTQQRFEFAREAVHFAIVRDMFLSLEKVWWLRGLLVKMNGGSQRVSE